MERQDRSESENRYRWRCSQPHLEMIPSATDAIIAGMLRSDAP